MNLSIIKNIEENLSKEIDEPRPYIGASSIGNPCERAIWYGLHQSESKIVTEKQRLTFEIGRRLEAMILDLINIDNMFMRSNIYLECKEYPLFQGHCDAVLYDSITFKPILLIEIKTAKDSSFNTFVKKGLRLWYPEYYDQVQSYMGMSDVHECYMLVLNKDTSELAEELVLYDEIHFMGLVEKAKKIGMSADMPKRINESASYFKCKYCFYNKVCHDL